LIQKIEFFENKKMTNKRKSTLPPIFKEVARAIKQRIENSELINSNHE
jgi:hypothetical protein